MEITLIQAIILSVWGFIAGTDRMSEAFFWFRPIIVSTVSGIILQDPVNGAIVGGLTELAFAGLTPAGGAVPPDPVVAGIMGAVFACCTDVGPTAAVGLALPFSVLMQYIVMLMYTAYLGFMKKLDQLIEDVNIKGMIRMNILGLVFVGLSYMIFTFLAAYLMQDVISSLIDIIPTWVMHGLEVAGGVMPALGFAMLLTTMFKIEYTPFLIIGFLAATFGGFANILPVALIGLAFALYNYFFGNKEKSESGSHTEIEGDYSNGI